MPTWPNFGGIGEISSTANAHLKMHFLAVV
jgi:hypothetical protein